MKMTYEKALETLTNEQKEEVKNDLGDSDYEVASVVMGYQDEEAVWHGYNDGCEPMKCTIYLLGGLYYVDVEDEFDGWVEYVFDNKKEAIAEMNCNENMYGGSIEEMIEEFLQDMSNSDYVVEVAVNGENGRSGNFFSYDIYHNGMMIQEGAFSLDAEEIRELLDQYYKMNDSLNKTYGITISSIIKKKDFFERYYCITFEKDEIEIDRRFDISPILQGITRSPLEFLSKKDIIDIVDEFQQYME